jgi:tRNA A37 methylthiotransferase MiaB
MRALGEAKRRRFHDTLVGQMVEVLVETEVDASSGLYRGRTSNYVPVNIYGHTSGKNRFVTVKVEKSLGVKGVIAHPISSPGGP